MSIRVFIIIAMIPALAVAAAVPAAQQDEQEQQQRARAELPEQVRDEYDLALKGADILQELTNTPDSGIPRQLLDRAYGIAVVPRVIKAAFVLGGRWGKGLLSVRQNGEWGPPVFIELAGGSLGFQAGVEAVDLVLVFTEKGSVDSLLDSNLTLGANVSVAVGPVGRHASAATDAKLDAAIYSYSRAKGLFAGIALDGARVTPDNAANKDVYEMNAEEVLTNAQISPATQPFRAALRQYAPAGERRAQ